MHAVRKTDKTIEAFEKLLTAPQTSRYTRYCKKMCYVHKHIKGGSLFQERNNWVLNGVGQTCTKELRWRRDGEFQIS